MEMKLVLCLNRLLLGTTFFLLVFLCSCTSELENTKNELDKTINALDQLQGRYNDLVNRYNDLDNNSKSEIQRLEQDRKFLQDEIARLQQDYSNYIEEMRNAQQNPDTLRSLLIKYAEKIQEKEREAIDLNSKVIQLESAILLKESQAKEYIGASTKVLNRVYDKLYEITMQKDSLSDIFLSYKEKPQTFNLQNRIDSIIVIIRTNLDSLESKTNISDSLLLLYEDKLKYLQKSFNEQETKIALLIRTLNTGYYRIGSVDELVADNILIENKKGFFQKRTYSVNWDLVNTTNFTPIMKDKVAHIPLLGNKPKIYTQHNPVSYNMKSDISGNAFITIKDETEFWKSGNFLIIATE